jgi:hypothetical protein
MATITRFEDIVAWQEARQLTKHVYEMTRCEPERKKWNADTE